MGRDGDMTVVSQTQDITVERLIEDRPQFHTKSDGVPVSWAVCPDVLRFIAETVQPGWATLETGSGHTTVTFAMAGANHTAVTPSASEAEKIREYCAKMGIESPISFVLEPSDHALPRRDVIPEELDFVLIDGAHAFPFPFVDFHYAEQRLRMGGIMGVDDVFMPSVRILYDFLVGEDNWELVRQIEDTAFFRRVGSYDAPGDPWLHQNINKAFWERKLRRERSRVRWLFYAAIRVAKNPRHYLARLWSG